MNATRTGMSTVDAVVIGGGVSGLVVARRLVAAGAEVAVLEARPQVGGRTLLTRAAEVTVDQGGQWLGTNMGPLRELLAELGIGTNSNPSLRDPGAGNIWHRDGSRNTYEGDLPPLSENATIELLTAIGALQDVAADVEVGNPWDSARAVELDSTTLEHWLSEHVADEDVRYLLTQTFTLNLGAPPAQMSLLYAAWFLNGVGGFEAMASSEAERISGGAGSIAHALAAGLGDRVRCDWPVRTIEHSGDGVRVIGLNGDEITAARVVVAMSPADARHIEFRPHLPTSRQLLQRNWQQFAAVKFHAIYDRPFWRDEGLSGAVLSDLPPAPIVLDDSPDDGSAGVLVGLLGVHGPRLLGGNEPELLDDPQRLRAAVLNALTAYFGERAGEPIEFLTRNWAVEPYISGAIATTPPGLLSAHGAALRPAVGPIHWAGSETATRWAGWISGAIEAGERAAGEVAAALSR
ncbi:FAD-dependent oxidoreductase [Saccharopolyspora sp. NPDC050389]|uniref:flavin monoamine oxidase family protein n=1 Tax=Saccharopolyspora sp. NPDC050389 TaxID=3155516 RepID=UPI0033CD1CB6